MEISGTQIAFIKNRCTEYKVVVEKLILKVIGAEKGIETLSRDEAQNVCAFLNQVQTNREDITEKIKETL